MTLDKAIEILDTMLANIPMTRQSHELAMQALNVLITASKPKQNKPKLEAVT